MAWADGSPGEGRLSGQGGLLLGEERGAAAWSCARTLDTSGHFSAPHTHWAGPDLLGACSTKAGERTDGMIAPGKALSMLR